MLAISPEESKSFTERFVQWKLPGATAEIRPLCPNTGWGDPGGGYVGIECGQVPIPVTDTCSIHSQAQFQTPSASPADTLDATSLTGMACWFGVATAFVMAAMRSAALRAPVIGGNGNDVAPQDRPPSPLDGLLRQ